MPCSWIGCLCIIKISVLSKLTYRLSAILIKELNKLILSIYKRGKTLQDENQIGKACHTGNQDNALVIKTMKY